MKKFCLILMLLIFFTCLKSSSMTFEDAYNKSSSKPAVVLIYADWADGYQTIQRRFRAVQARLAGKYNFVEVNIANKDAKLLNSRYYIYPNLPYVFLIRNNGKVTKHVTRDCLTSTSCLMDKISTFSP